MDQNGFIKQLLKRRSDLMNQLCSMQVIWEGSAPYGNMEKHLENEIRGMESLIKSMDERHSMDIEDQERWILSIKKYYRAKTLPVCCRHTDLHSLIKQISSN